MGRKKVPTALKRLKGRPLGALIDGEFMPPAELPTPPKELSRDARKEWRRISKDLYLQGILTKYDRAALAIHCQLYGRWVMAERMLREEAKKDPINFGLVIHTENGNLIQNPLVGICNKSARDCLRYATEFGLTPNARMRIHIAPGPSNKPKTKKSGWFD